MRKARDLLRLCLGGGMSGRRAAASVGVSASTASVYISRAREAGLTWERVAAMDDTELERVVAPAPAPANGSRPMPDIEHVRRELAKADVTLSLVWQEYKAEHGDGYQYSQFCEVVGRELRRADVVLRRQHKAGAEMHVDWAGRTVPIVEADSALSAIVEEWDRERHSWRLQGRGRERRTDERDRKPERGAGGSAGKRSVEVGAGRAVGAARARIALGSAA